MALYNERLVGKQLEERKVLLVENEQLKARVASLERSLDVAQLEIRRLSTAVEQGRAPTGPLRLPEELMAHLPATPKPLTMKPSLSTGAPRRKRGRPRKIRPDENPPQVQDVAWQVTDASDIQGTTA